MTLTPGDCFSPSRADFPGTALAQADPDAVATGEYLVVTSGCHDCHTPFIMGPTVGAGYDPGVVRPPARHCD